MGWRAAADRVAQLLEWIQNAKKLATRARRVDETVQKAARNLRANQWRA